VERDWSTVINPRCRDDRSDEATNDITQRGVSPQSGEVYTCTEMCRHVEEWGESEKVGKVKERV
jgi:hypothetical protein